MKKYIPNIALFCLMTGLVISCANKNFKDHIGPSICASETFEYVQKPKVSSASVNLNTTPVVFTAKFNEEVPWAITVTGMVSKSFKKFSGYGKEINVSWQGNPDTLVFFQVEQCKVKFEIACKDPIIRNFNITTVNSFVNYDALVYNGDGAGQVLTPVPYGTYVVHALTAGLNSPQGGNCWCTTGSSPSPVWYFGGLDMNVVLGSNIDTNPENVYFNAFVNVEGNKFSLPVLTITEGSAKRNINVDLRGKTGWQNFYFKLSDIGVINPRNITIVSWGLNAYPVQGTSGKMCIDFVTFTNGAPFVK